MQRNKQSMWRSNTPGEPKRRHMLKDILPLEIPLSLDVEVSSRCCLKCRYCPQSLPEKRKQDINLCSGNGRMEMSLFQDIIRQCKEFPLPLKNIRFAGFGEPLLNKEIDKMVSLIKKENIAETVTIFTNGIMLTHELSRKLVDGGVDTFLIDVQGINDDDYKRVSNTEIRFQELYENIKYLSKLPFRGKIFIKIFKFAIRGREEEFFSMFSPYCDEIGIENLYEIYPEIDYTGMLDDEKESCGIKFYSSKYCSYPWFQMAIDASGRVTACTLPVSKNSDFLRIGNVRQESLKQIWTGNRINNVRKSLLTQRFSHEECRNCKYTELLPKEDLIDNIVPELEKYCKSMERSF